MQKHLNLLVYPDYDKLINRSRKKLDRRLSMNTYTAWENIIDVIKSGQVGLSTVIRWSKYDKEEGGGVRIQNSLQHSYSIALLGKMLIHKLRDYVTLDEPLLITALLVHDHGEGEINKDTHYIDKSVDGDLDEYLAFTQRYSALGKSQFEEFQKAFLLQFALKNPSCFPEQSRKIMEQLEQHKLLECNAFDAVERWDYLLYAIEQFEERGNKKVLVQTLRNQIPHLNRLAEVALPGFGAEIWTTQMRLWCQNFVSEHDGQWIEQKGEK